MLCYLVVGIKISIWYIIMVIIFLSYLYINMYNVISVYFVGDSFNIIHSVIMRELDTGLFIVIQYN